jgi:putative salt-induced outer membrane protein YdiY
MKKRQILAALTLFCAFAAQADEVFLKNGDRLTGTIVNKSGSVLEMKTDYAEKIVIKWIAVRSFKSDNPVLLTLNNKEELTGVTSTADGNALTIKRDGVYQSQPIPLTEIKEVNKKYFAGQANAGGMIAGGNTQRQAYHMDGEIIVRGRDDRVSFGGQYNYADNTAQDVNGLESTTLNARNWQLYADYSHFFTDQWYGYAHGLFTNDRLQDIKLRSAFGIGAGYQFFATEDLNLAFEAGPDYVSVDFYDVPLICGSLTNPCTPLQDRSSFAGRWSVKYDQWFWDRTVQAFHVHEGLIGTDLFIRSRTGFRVPLWRGLQVSNEIQVDYFGNPAPGRQNVDTRYLFTIGYVF